MNSSIQEFDVAVVNKGPQGIQEPIAIWNSTLSRVTTDDVRNQLGVAKNRSTSTLQSRGIWSLQGDLIFSQIKQFRDTWKVPKEITTSAAFNTTTYPWIISLILTDMSSIVLCPKCSHDGQRQASAILVQTFNDVLKDTKSPALALQDILTLVIRVNYYDWIQAFNDKGLSTSTRFQAALIPIHNGGIIAVIVIVLGFLLFCVFTTYLFFSYTHETLLSDSWQSVLQLSESAEVQLAMQDASLSTDREVRKWITGDKLRKREKFRLGTAFGGNTEVVTTVATEAEPL
jgi:hypothetical protein